MNGAGYSDNHIWQFTALAKNSEILRAVRVSVQRDLACVCSPESFAKPYLYTDIQSVLYKARVLLSTYPFSEFFPTPKLSAIGKHHNLL